MGRNVESVRSGYNTRAKLYQSQIEDTNEVIRKIELQTPIVFYAKDYQDFKYVRNQFGEMQRQLSTGLIETMDLEAGVIKIHDTVEYSGVLYNVEELEFIDKNLQKGLRNRLETKTIIKLGGVVSGW